MQVLLIAVAAGVAFIIAYHTYGRWLGSKVFNLAAGAVCPSVKLRDDNDYVPTSKSVVFGHHFTSIAGTGPIVGPAIAVMWGWLPALLWVVFGSIFIGAVHDFGALVVSLRNNGQTVGEISGRLLNKRVRLLFLFVLFLALTIVIAIFGLVIAAVFKQYPAAIFPCLVQIPIAVAIGVYLHRKGVGLLLPSILALGVMYGTVIFGDAGLLGAFNAYMASLHIITWVAILLIYSYIASVLPVWLLLQPRDYINSLQLVSALGLIVVGLCVAAFMGGAPPVEGAERQPLEFAAPMVQWDPADAPMIFPFLFITIACGAISGFHCLVSSGTSSKQIKCESDAQFVGYGSMLTEGFLAVIVILACVAGLGLGIDSISNPGTFLTGADAYADRYATWQSAAGLGAKVGAFVEGAANFVKALGLDPSFAIALMGVFVASFAATTLDTACRLQRYVTQELAATLKLHPLTNKHAATILAISVAFIIAAMPVGAAEWSWANGGKGGLNLWPLFGATNQLLAGLAFLVILFWMWRRNIPVWFIAIPASFMLVLPGAALGIEIFKAGGWLDKENYLLIGIAAVTLGLEIWIIIEALVAWPKAKGLIEPQLQPLGQTTQATPDGGRSC